MTKKKESTKHRDCRKITRCVDCLFLSNVSYLHAVESMNLCKQYSRPILDVHGKPKDCAVEWIIIVSDKGVASNE
jgi:hypothetical protein